MSINLLKLPFLLALIGLITPSNGQNPPSTHEIIAMAVQGMETYNNNETCPFWYYKYGTAIEFDAMYRAMEFYPDFNWDDLMSKWLDYWLNSDPNTPSYQIANGDYIPWNSSFFNDIGDQVGIIPIAYLSRIEYYQNNNLTRNFTRDWAFINRTANYYIPYYPNRLPDGTISRQGRGNWSHEPYGNHSFVWADDTYMGLTLLVRTYKYFENPIFIDMLIEQLPLFYKHLSYLTNEDNVTYFHYAHGYNDLTGDISCCPWGRANAWLFVAFTEVYYFLDSINQDNSYDAEIQELKYHIVNQSIGLATYQDEKSGLWHQVLNVTQTYLETTASCAFLYAIIPNLMNGLYDHLPDENIHINWDQLIHNAWNGIVSTVNLTDGRISGCCRGTGISNTWMVYNNQSTDYCLSGDPGGPGHVIRAALAYQQYIDFTNQA